MKSSSCIYFISLTKVRWIFKILFFKGFHSDFLFFYEVHITKVTEEVLTGWGGGSLNRSDTVGKVKLQQWKIPERQKRVSWSWEKYNPGITPHMLHPVAHYQILAQSLTQAKRWLQMWTEVKVDILEVGGGEIVGRAFLKDFYCFSFLSLIRLRKASENVTVPRKKRLDETTGLSGTEQWQYSYQQLPRSACAGLGKQTGCRPHGRVGFPHSPMTFVTAVGTAPASGAASAVPSSAPTSRIASWSTIKVKQYNYVNSPCCSIISRTGRGEHNKREGRPQTLHSGFDSDSKWGFKLNRLK